jgi:hypothetical protein
MSRLIQLDVIRAGHDHHDDTTVFALLNRTSELSSFRTKLADRRLDVVAHQCDRVVTRVIIGLAFPFAVRWVHTHLARPRFENEPIVIEILGDVVPPEHVTQKRPRCVGVIDWLGAVGLGFICRRRNWAGRLLQAAIGYRVQEMP